jgi:type VI secretion system FHA domain protein
VTLTLSVLRCPDAAPPETRRLTGGEFRIGRAPDNDWVLSDPDRVLSKRHCVIAWRGGAWQIADTSTNGTFINNDAAPLGAGAVHVLTDGDRLRLGAYEIEARIAAETGFTAAPAAAVTTTRSATIPSPLPPPPRRQPGRQLVRRRQLDLAARRFRSARPRGTFVRCPGAGPSARAPRCVPPTRPGPETPPRRLGSLDRPRSNPIPPNPGTPNPGPANPASGFRTPPQPAPIPPTLAASPPPVAPVAPAAPSVPPPDTALLGIFLAAAGMTGDAADPAETMRRAGLAFRAMVAGLRQAMIARAAIKGEFRIEQTMIRARGNNPLKFSADDDDAMAALLGLGRRTEMDAGAAVSDALRDIRLHEIAVMGAMQSAVRALLARLDPAALRSEAEQARSLIPAQRKARAFDAFEALHASITLALADDFDSVFGREFARAYERALSEAESRDR